VTALHYADVELDGDGEPWLVRFVCTGSPEEVCRQWCAEGCEEACYGEPIRLWPHDEELVAQAPPAGHRWEPYSKDGTSCRIVDWLDAVGWEETGWVDDGNGDREVTVVDLRPGRHRIEEEWTGDDYIWRYPAEVTA
jgi:hypothetical protein